MALAFHPHDEDISNAALGLVVSLAAQAREGGGREREEGREGERKFADIEA